MRTVTLCIFSLILSASSHAQRYRLASDTTYTYDYGQQAYVVDNIDRFIYKPGSEMGSTYMCDTVYYDTLYEYKVNNDIFDTDATTVRTYDKNNIITESVYNGIPASGTPRRSDTFTYKKKHLVKEARYCKYLGCHSSDPYGMIKDDAVVDRLFLYSLKEYTYQHGQLVDVKEYAPPTHGGDHLEYHREIKNNKDGKPESYVTYKYDFEGNPALDEQRSFYYRDGRLVQVIATEYSEGDTVWSQHWYSYDKAGHMLGDSVKIKHTMWQDTLYKYRTREYNDKGLNTKVTYREYTGSDDEPTVDYVFYNVYNERGYLIEDRVKGDGDNYLTKYIYEQY